MKIASLLAQYLYLNHRLDIPFVGTIFYEGINVLETPCPDSIRFVSDRSIRESDELVSFISSTTGKIKPLAAADLISFWEQSRQFLHIGKPFELEGIGSILKSQNGDYHFTPENLSFEKTNEIPGKPPTNGKTKNEDSSIDYKSILYINKVNENNWKRPMVVILFVLGLGAAVFGGYLISRRNAQTLVAEGPMQYPPELVASKKTDTMVLAPNIIDSLSMQIPNSVQLKFVVEEAKKDRAIKRYSFLRNNGLAIEMSTKDSVDYQLYFSISIYPADSTHVLDSLQNFYTPAGKKAYIARN